MKLKLLIISCLFLIFSTLSYSQINNDSLKFLFPLKQIYKLAGNFGEPRTAHFHTGIDFSTISEGKEIIAIQDGFISRISISPSGYGNAIYIQHKSGYTSVYGHMSKFNKKLQDWIENIQYEQKTFKIDTSLNEDLFLVKRGEVIGFTGNTGNSAAPHLHFELRETESENAINTLGNIYKITDNTPPQIAGIVIYPISENSIIDNKNEKLFVKTIGGNGKYSINTKNINFSGYIGLGIEYYDRVQEYYNKYGVKHTKVFVNDELIYHSEIDKINSVLQKQKDTHFDFEYSMTAKKDVQRCWIEDGNNLELYKKYINKGIILSEAEKTYDIKIELTDFNSNVSYVNFQLMGNAPKVENEILKKRENQLKILGGCRVEVNVEDLFSHFDIDVQQIGETQSSYIYKVGNENIALRQAISVSIYSDKILEDYDSKVFMFCKHHKSNNILNVEREGNYFTAKSRYLGNFSLIVDSTPPQIKLINFRNGSNLSSHKEIKVKISDDISGITDYNFYIDDVWVLAKYDAKTGHLYYDFDGRMPSGKEHKLVVEIKDRAGNTASETYNFIYIK